MFPWEDYRHDLFIDCKEQLQHIKEWANKQWVPERIKLILASPGAGKTWFMKAVRDQWMPLDSVGSSAMPERLLIWVDVPSLVNSGLGSHQSDMIDNSATLDWLEQVQGQALAFCSNVHPINRAADPSYLIDRLVIDLCDRCQLHRAPIVFVDGYEQVSKAQAQIVTKRILEPLLTRECVRMLISLRDEQALKTPTLANYGMPMRLPDVLLAKEQFQTLVKKCSSSGVVKLRTLIKLLPFYKWDHFFINNFLFDHMLDSSNHSPFVDLGLCFERLLERPDASGQPSYLSLDPTVFALLKSMAKSLSDEWLSQELENKLQRDLHDPMVEQLFKYGVIYKIKDTPHYKIAGGMREILKSL